MRYRQLLLVIITAGLLSLPSACDRESVATDSAGGSEAAAAAASDSKQSTAKGPTDVLILTDSNFSKYVSKKTPVAFVDFYATWCGPCKRMAPVTEELAKSYDGRVVFGKVNIELNPKLVKSYSVNKLPTFIVFKNGEPVDSFIGLTPKDVVKSRIDKAFK